MRSIWLQGHAPTIALAAWLALGAGPALAGAVFTLDPHRAVYDLTLKSREPNATVSSVRGRMVHEFTGAACEGYSVAMRWVAQMGDTDGDINVDDVRLASFEDGTGQNFTYTSTRFLNDKMVEEVKARAKSGVDAKAGHVVLTKPQDEELDLPAATIFPITHLKRILAAAREGETFAEESVYDVSETGRTVYNTLAVVGPKRSAADLKDAAIPASDQVKALAAWRVTISYFKGKADGEETPAFEQTFDLLENGVATNLLLDYGDIMIRGTLSDLQFLARPDCAGAPDGR